MSIQSLRKALKRDFLLDLSEGFVYDCLHRKVQQLDMANANDCGRCSRTCRSCGA